MKEITAHLRYLRMAPRKVRLVASSMQGKSAKKADAHLKFLAKSASRPLRKLLQSAVANAKHNFRIDIDDLRVHRVTVNKGPTLKRFKPRSRGMANPIHKHTSHITLMLSQTK